MNNGRKSCCVFQAHDQVYSTPVADTEAYRMSIQLFKHGKTIAHRSSESEIQSPAEPIASPVVEVAS